jgi:hypothetical protein
MRPKAHPRDRLICCFRRDDGVVPAGQEQDENADERSGSAIRRDGDAASVMPWGHEVCGLVAAAQGRRSLRGPPGSLVGVSAVGCRT